MNRSHQRDKSIGLNLGARYKKAAELIVGDLVDLTSCPYLYGHPSAKLSYARVESVEQVESRLSGMVIAVQYENLGDVDYAPGQSLVVMEVFI